MEASTTKVVRNWVPALGSRLSLRGRRYLAMLNMLLINAASIGACARMGFCRVCLQAAA